MQRHSTDRCWKQFVSVYWGSDLKGLSKCVRDMSEWPLILNLSYLSFTNIFQISKKEQKVKEIKLKQVKKHPPQSTKY